jgi:hypothetical protein
MVWLMLGLVTPLCSLFTLATGTTTIKQMLGVHLDFASTFLHTQSTRRALYARHVRFLMQMEYTGRRVSISILLFAFLVLAAEETL